MSGVGPKLLSLCSRAVAASSALPPRWQWGPGGLWCDGWSEREPGPLSLPSAPGSLRPAGCGGG